MNNIEIKQGDANYSAQAEAASAESIANAIEAVQIYGATFAHGQFFDMSARHIGGAFYIVAATANDGYNSYLRRFLVDKSQRPVKVTELDGVKAVNAVAGKRKVDSGVDLPGLALAVVHDPGNVKTLEMAELPSDTDLLPEHGDFSDVPRYYPNGQPNPFYAPVMACARRGVISGYADGSFGAGGVITRQQFTVMLARAMGWV